MNSKNCIRIGLILAGLIFVNTLTVTFSPTPAFGDDFTERGPAGGGSPPDGPPCSGCCGGCCEEGSCCGGCCSEDECDCPPLPPPPGPSPPGGGGGGGGYPIGGDPVYIKNGEFKLSATDVRIPGRTLSVAIKRTYNSRRAYNSRFGFGWDINYNLKIRRLDDPNTIVLLNGKACQRSYTKDDTDPNLFLNEYHHNSYFYYDDVNDTFAMSSRDSLWYDFDGNDNLACISDKYDNKITFTYDSNGLMPLYGPSDFFVDPNYGGPSDGRGLVAMSYMLVKITDDLGRDLDLSYNADGLLDEITDFTGRTWSYAYDPNTNDLLAVTGPSTTEYPDGLTVSYYYDEDEPDNKHNLEYIYDANDDLVVANYYDSEDKVWKQTVGDGDYIFDYNEDANTATITDREGYRTEMVYGDNGQLVSETVFADGNDPNFTTTYVYDPETRQRTGIIYPKGNCVAYTYDDLGNLTGIYRKTEPDDPNTASDSNVIATLYTYDANLPYEVNSITDAVGNVTYYDYNETTGHLDKIRYPDDSNVAFTYNSFGQVETQTTPDGLLTKYEYYDTNQSDPNYGRLWKVIVDYGDANRATEYAYDWYANIVEVTDPNGNITKSEYDNLDQLIKSIAPSPFNYVTKFTYDEKGNRSAIEREITDDPNQITKYVYNALNNLRDVNDPLGNITTYGYNYNEDMNSITDAENNKTKYEYDERRLVTKITDANDGETKFTYDKNGNPTDINDPNGDVSSFTYDKFDRLVKIVYPDDSNEQFEYDKNGNMTKKTTRKGENILYKYDVMNRIAEVNRPGDPNIIFTYDVAGRLIDVNDQRAVSSGGGISSYSFTKFGEVNEVNDIYGHVVKYEYDELGRRMKLVYPDDSNVTYEYDELSRLTYIKDEADHNLAHYEYDELSGREKVTIGNDSATELPLYYDDATIEYEWDLGNRLRKVTNTTASCYENLWSPETITFEYAKYDKVGNRLSMKIDSDPSHVYDYDKLYQLYYVDYNDDTTIRYDYDKLGNRDDVNVGGTHTAYTHNSLNQYESVASKSYSYDDNGNLTDDGYTYYTYDCENRLLSSTCDTLNTAHLGPDVVENGTFTGNANGWTLGSGGNGGWYYENNHVWYGSYQTAADMEQAIDGLQANRTYKITYQVLSVYTPYGTSSVGIELGGANAGNVTLSAGTQTRYVTTSNSTGNFKFKGTTTGLIQIDFDNISVEMLPDADVVCKYDYRGRRVKKVVTAAYGTASSTTTTFTYDGDQVIAEYDGEGNLLRKFVYGPGIDEPVCIIDATDNDKVYYYFFDGLGSVAGLSDATGNLVERYTYDVFGKPTIEDADGAWLGQSNVGNPYMFTARRYDHESGTYYYRAREYDPEIGRFMSPDPIYYLESLNLYRYVNNNPLVYTDPSGLMPEAIGGAAPSISILREKPNCQQRCDLWYTLNKARCHIPFFYDCWTKTPIYAGIKWARCMEQARSDHIICIADCPPKG